ncbi:MAG: hypothetical protein JXQ99_26520 [Hyphomicrobiaceae bacterium]
MFDRTNYGLADFLLFSARVYDRMFELHNAALWPTHFLALVFGGYIVAVALKPSRRGARIVFVLLALIWLSIAAVFFAERYASINWAAVYIVPIFVLQALLLGLLARRSEATVISSCGRFSDALTRGVLLFSLLGYPLAVVVLGRPWYGTELFAIAPDPTVTATLAFLVMARGTVALLATIIPLFWVVITSLTLYALGSHQFAIAPLAALVCGVAYIRRR